jgi:hypothetical protein
MSEFVNENLQDSIKLNPDEEKDHNSISNSDVQSI